MPKYAATQFGQIFGQQCDAVTETDTRSLQKLPHLLRALPEYIIGHWFTIDQGDRRTGAEALRGSAPAHYAVSGGMMTLVLPATSERGGFGSTP